jgi:hypothetical protein
MRFYVGTDRLRHAARLQRAFISVNVLKQRKSNFPANDWIMDSGAFTTIAQHGAYPDSPAEYARHIKRWASAPGFTAAVSQDYMCEDVMLRRTGLSVQEHIRLTVERYDALMGCDVGGALILPVLQGFHSGDYLACLHLYGERLAPGAWVGVGSVCKRNGSPAQILYILSAIRQARPDLKLHGFGIKTTALAVPAIRESFYSADSMAWSYHARKQGRDQHSIDEALMFETKIASICSSRLQGGFFGE